jgi:hypothetical protein
MTSLTSGEISTESAVEMKNARQKVHGDQACSLF